MYTWMKLSIITSLCVGCMHQDEIAKKAQLAAEAAAYQAELTTCFKKAEETDGLYSTYMRCAEEVSDKYGISRDTIPR